MKYALATIALLAAVGSAVAEEYKVTGVLCKEKDDLKTALLATNLGAYLPDTLAQMPGCRIVLMQAVPFSKVQFLEWVPAAIIKVRIYKGLASINVTADDGTTITSPSGVWFFTPIETLEIPPSKEVQQMIPT